jgi:threonine/homoserine/homoserine lactone efflux protein
MYGALLGVFIIVVLCSIGIATIMTKYPFLLIILKYLGGSNLICRFADQKVNEFALFI